MKARICFAYAFLMLCISPAFADDPDSMVSFNCDSEHSQLLIETFSQQMQFDAPYPRIIKASDTTISMRGLMWAKESDRGIVTWHKKEIRRICHLGKHTYVATLNGYKFNENIQGMCGAGSPTLSLTVHRNGKLVANNLLFNNSCASHIVIESIRFLPEIKVAVIGTHNENDHSNSEVRASTGKPITMKRLLDEK